MRPPEDVLLAMLVVAIAFVAQGSIKAIHAVVEGRPLWEPQWKREAAYMARFVPTGDEWGR